MKKYINIIFLALAAGALLFSSCTEKEDLGFSDNDMDSTLSLSIDGFDEGIMSVAVDGSYDENGELELTGEVTRSYTFALNKPALDEVLLKVEPFALNIPEDKYSISATNLVIPVGERAATVTVALALNEEGAEDTAFIAEEMAPQNYELGVRLVSMDGGDNVHFSGEKEAKVEVDKIAYEALLTVEGTNNNSATFKRSFAEREILDEEPMTYTFRVVLNRPAHEDVTFNFETTGLPDQFKNTLTFSPEEIIIPAGEKSTGYIQMTLADDFLETTTENETHDIAIKVVPVCDDPTLVVNEESRTINFHIIKFRNVLKSVTSLDSSWVEYDYTGWSAYFNEIGGTDAGLLYTGASWSYYAYQKFVIVLDMLEERDVDGFRLEYYYGSWGYDWYGARSTTIEISNDGETWEMLGTADGQKGIKFIQVVGGAKGRYCRITGEYYSSMYPTLFKVYHD